MSFNRYRYVGRTELPSRMTAEEVAEHCTLSSEQIEAIKAQSGRQHKEQNFLALAVQVVSVALMGRQPPRKAVIAQSLLKSLCEQLQIYRTAPTIAALKTIYENDFALQRHREVARTIVGISPLDDDAASAVRGALDAGATNAASVDELVTIGERWLFDNKRLIPGDRAVRDMARDAFRHVEEAALATVHAAVSQSRLRAIVKLLFEESLEPKVTILEWLRKSAGKHNVKNIQKIASRIEYLRGLGVDEWDLSGISSARLKAFALQVIHRPPSESARRVEDTQAVEIVCFLKYALRELSDENVERFKRRVSDLVRKGQKNVQKKQANRSAFLRESMQSMRAMVDDKSKTPTQRLKLISDLLDEALGAPSVSTADVVRDSLTQDNVRVRTVLSGIDCLDIQGDADEKDFKIVKALKELRDNDAKGLPDDFDMSIVDPSWSERISNPDRVQALQAFNGYAATRIRQGLVGGRLVVPHSGDYRGAEDMMIPLDEWERDGNTICQNLGLDRSPTQLIEKLLAELATGLQAVAEDHEKGLFDIDADGSVRIGKFRAAEEDPELRSTATMMSDAIGSVQLPDIVMELDSKIRFSRILLGREAKDAQELISLYGGLLAQGTEIDAKGAAAMIPNLRAADITAAMKVLETPGRLRLANDAVVAFQQSIPIVQLWGDGKKASSDMMSLDATRHLAAARQEPRRKTPAIGIYTHILGSYPIIHDMPIVLMTRQNGPAVEGIERYNSIEERTAVELLAVDTHGYTYPGMAVAKLLKFDLCPQLAGLPDCSSGYRGAPTSRNRWSEW